MARQYFELPDIIDNYVLNPEHSFFAFALPKKAFNYFHNPEVFSLDAIEFTGPTKILDIEEQQYGISSVNVVGSAGDELFITPVFSPDATENNAIWSFGAKGFGSFTFEVRQGATVIARHSTIESGHTFWHRYSIVFPFNGNSATPYQLFIIMESDVDLYFDGFQYEAGSRLSTFISGGQGSGYEWLGGPDNSISLRREEAIGGEIWHLHELGLQVFEFEDMGFPELDQILQPLAAIDKSLYKGHSIKERAIALTGRVCGASIVELLCTRWKLGKDIVGKGPIRMLFQPYLCLDPQGPCLYGDVIYTEGLEGEYDNLFGQDVTLEFTMPCPYFCECGNSATKLQSAAQSTLHSLLGINETGDLENFNGGVQYSCDGDLPINNIGPTLDSAVGPDGNIYIVGDWGPHFNEDCGYPGPDNFGIVCWDGNTASTIGGLRASEAAADTWIVTNVEVYGSRMYVSGFFDEWQGILGPVRGMVYYDFVTQTWSDWGEANQGFANNYEISAIELTNDGYIYAVGSFDRIDTGGISNNIARYNLTTGLWEPVPSAIGFLGASPNAPVVNTAGQPRAIKQIGDWLYITGDFDNDTANPNDPAFRSFIRYNLKTDVAEQLDWPQTGLIPGNGLVIEQLNNFVFLGGDYNSSQFNGVSAGDIGGVTWFSPSETSLGGNIDFEGQIRGPGYGGDGQVFGIVRDMKTINGELHIVGTFTEAGPTNTPEERLTDLCGYVIFVQTGLTPDEGYFKRPLTEFGEYPPTGECELYHVNCFPDYAPVHFLLGGQHGNIGGLGQVPGAVTSVGCDGMIDAPVKLVIHGPVEFGRVWNEYTNVTIEMDYEVVGGETVYMDLTGASNSIISTYRGDISNFVLPGSDFANFIIKEGDNIIRSSFVSIGGSVALHWNNCVWSLDAAGCWEC